MIPVHFVSNKAIDEVRHLKELTEEKFKRVDQQFTSHDNALGVATTAMNYRLEQMNEFRQQLTDQAAKFITRPEHEALIDIIAKTQKLVWMGLGAVMVIGAVIQVMLFMLQTPTISRQYIDKDTTASIIQQLDSLNQRLSHK